jgi:hypothetical protein
MTTNDAGGASAGPKDDEPVDPELLKQQAEFLRLGYTRCTIRYNEIYASVWSIFSFLAAGTGVLLGFAKDAIPARVLYGGALLVFWAWYFVLFLPLNRYGNGVSKDAARLESEINCRFFGTEGVLNMFADFNLRRTDPKSSRWKKLRTGMRRVEFRLPVFLFAFTCLACWAYKYGWLEKSPPGPQRVVVEKPVVLLGGGSGR